MSVIASRFHAATAQFGAGQVDESARVAAKAIRALFEGTAKGREVLVGFYPMASIRDVSNESHVRFDLRSNVLRVICAREMLSAHFTNYYEAFVLAAAMLQEALTGSALHGGYTADLGNGSNLGSYPRIAFSSALPQAELVMDPGFFHSNGYQALREALDRRWVPWRERGNIAFWRGKSTGIPMPMAGGTDKELSSLQRLHLCDVARHSPQTRRMDVGLSEVVQVDSPQLRHAIAAAGLLRGPEPLEGLVQHRHAFVLDGNTSVDNDLIQTMLAGNCVLLVGSRFGFRSWFYNRLIPEQNHVPVRADLADLEERLNWVFDNPDECERIAMRAHALALAMTCHTEFAYSVGKIRNIVRP